MSTLTMHRFIAGLLLAASASLLPSYAADPAKKLEEVKYVLHSGHFESNKSGLKGDASYLLIKDAKTFESVFGTVPPLGAKKHNWVPKEAFDNFVVVAVIKRGNSPVTYTDVAVGKKDEEFVVTYKTVAAPPTTATFATPLVLTIDKQAGTKVVFVENGKVVGKAE